MFKICMDRMAVNFCGDQIFMDFVWSIIHEVLYAWCLRYNICSAWFLDSRISNCILVAVFTGLRYTNAIHIT